MNAGCGDHRIAEGVSVEFWTGLVFVYHKWPISRDNADLAIHPDS